MATIQLAAKEFFEYKPILIGGGAMEYYGMRERGHDFDFIVHREDAKRLRNLPAAQINHFGGQVKDKDGFSTDVDSTITINHFDYAVTMFQYDYEFFSPRAIYVSEVDYLVISKEDLLLLKALTATNRDGWEGSLAENIQKQRRDVDLIIKSIMEEKYKKGEWNNAVSFNESFEEEEVNNDLRF